MEFLSEMIQNFSKYFSEKYNTESYPNQNYESVKFLYEKCIEFNPDMVMDIGTNFGASTISFMRAMEALSKPLSLITTIDLDHDHWKNKTPKIQKIDLSKVKTITSDFKLIDPLSVIQNVRYFIFYDIHDTDSFSFSGKFINEWIPRLKNSIIAFHDVSIVSKDFEWRQDNNQYPMETIEYNGKFYAGYRECKTIIEWVKEKNIEIFDVPKTSIVWIKI